MAITESTWSFPGDKNTEKEMSHVVNGIIHNMTNADWSLCNWIQELDPTLDKQPKNSVVYVEFGSTSKFNQQQLEELAKGLDILNRPFLWVAWSGLTDKSCHSYSNKYMKRVASRGKIVEWASQEIVLGNPSIACFITHCGWSSVMESASMGVPLVCWPYFGDQMYAKSCICDAWKVGVWFKPNESGIVSRNEIKETANEVLSPVSLSRKMCSI
ncbi:UDP-glycosyltransferase 83A1-like [Primulina eburnea]|uniref:UDP-glycosyltransferase 83A1-like n=1 Tax=Primulina eburnea TaxID=1245227 RepID=UPI003C6C275E